MNVQKSKAVESTQKRLCHIAERATQLVLASLGLAWLVVPSDSAHGYQATPPNRFAPWLRISLIIPRVLYHLYSRGGGQLTFPSQLFKISKYRTQKNSQSGAPRVVLAETPGELKHIPSCELCRPNGASGALGHRPPWCQNRN